MRLAKKVKELFIETVKEIILTLFAIKKNPKIFFQVVLFSFLFWVSFGILVKSVNYLIEISTPFFLQLGMPLRILIGLTALSTSLLIPTLIYSFFKLIILSKIKSLFQKTKLSFKLFLKFYINNLLIFIFINIIFTIWLFLSSGVKVAWLKPYLLLTFTPLLFFTYSFINVFHSLVIKTENTRVLKKALKITFQRIGYYLAYLIFDGVIISAYFFIWWIIGLILLLADIQIQQKISEYNSVFTISFYIIAILLLAFNQIYFYKRISKFG